MARGAKRIYFTEAERKEAKRVANSRWWHRRQIGVTGAQARHQPPPSSVIEERDRALSSPQSLTASLLGDPPFSRSALAKREFA